MAPTQMPGCVTCVYNVVYTLVQSLQYRITNYLHSVQAY